jgi:ribulose kinase
MLGAIAAGRYQIGGAMTAMSRLSEEVTPTGGEIAALHERRRQAFVLLQDCERRSRALA